MSKNITFVLSEREDKRVILDTVAHGRVLEKISARDWLEARMGVTYPVYENPGYGYVTADAEEAA